MTLTDDALELNRLRGENAELRRISEARRVENLSLRERIGLLEKPKPESFRFGALYIDGQRRRVELDGKHLPMTRRMVQLLSFFAAHPGEVFTNEEILSHVWGSTIGYGKSNVTEQIRRIRLLIGPGWIENERGMGYRFEALQ